MASLSHFIPHKIVPASGEMTGSNSDWAMSALDWIMIKGNTFKCEFDFITPGLLYVILYYLLFLRSCIVVLRVTLADIE